MEVFVGCSSSEYISDKYLENSKIFLEELFSSDNDLVFGVCDKGLMGLSHDIAKKYGRDVRGICPELYKKQFKDVDCTIEEITKTVGERTKNVIEESDVLLFLPGGIGTIYELFSAIEWKRSCEFDKPIVIYNSFGHFDKLFEFLDMIYDNGFSSREIENCYYVCNDVKDALNYINNYYNLKVKAKKRDCFIKSIK